MADFRAVVRSGKLYTGIADADGLIVAQTVKTAAGTLTLSPAGAGVILDANKNLSMTAGTGAVDFSAASGTFSSSTGAHTFNGAVTMAAAKRFNAAAHAASAGLKVPTFAGVPTAVTGTVEGDVVWDSTNDDLYVYDGAAFVLINQAAAAATSVTTTKVAAETIASKALVVVQNDGGVASAFNADANGASPKFYPSGVAAAGYTATQTATIIMSGEVAIPDAQWDAVPAVTDVGLPVYASTTAGKYTINPTSTTGEYQSKVGQVATGGTGAVTILLQLGQEPYLNP